MKNKPYTYYLLCMLWSFFPVAQLGAQGGGFHSAVADSLVNPSLLKEGGQVLHFDSLDIHIGKLYDSDAPRTYTFRFRNVSSSDVRITKVSTSCGCTAATVNSKTITPGAEGSVVLVYNPKNNIGTVKTYAFVYTTVSAKYPVVRLTLTGEVVCSDEWDYLPYAMGAVRMKRKQVVFSEVTSSIRPSERILCANTSKNPLKLSARMLPPYAGFHSEPNVIPPGQEGDLVITVDGHKLPEKAPDKLRFTFIVEGVDAPLSDRLVNVIINRIQ
ncbi:MULTISPECIES: DUF1573 domain-containing protein [Bacteroides]|uniref:DUF1573 domain-containing protein n=1 Tax=Bacteroides faecium TaxID=2715212 RepID=A0A6H0KQR2_9BACE|nr:DUF1573 domain-containing protein [Bacteroides faecium]QIU95371.1 DUF1573 domain-containing protein [Bacteroides faecium]